MRNFLKKILIYFIAPIFAVVLVLCVLIFISGINMAVKNHEQGKSLGLLVDAYSQKRSAEEIIQLRQNLDALTKIGKCVSCDLSARTGEEDSKDLYEAIKSLNDKKMPIDLSQANLSMVNLSFVYENGESVKSRASVDLSGANLSGADLRRASLMRANLSKANLRGADLTGATLIEANLSGADLTGAILSLTFLYKADLSKAIMHEAILEGTDLRRANLTQANLTDALITRIASGQAKFVEADLRGATILTRFGQSEDFTNTKFSGFFYVLPLWLVSRLSGLLNEIKMMGWYWKLRRESW